MDQKKKNILFKLVLILVILFVLVALGYYLWQRFYTPSSYTIPGVPYYGIYNVPSADFRWEDIAAAMSSVFSYWHNFDSSLSNPDFKTLAETFPGRSSSIDNLKSMKEAFEKFGFQAEIVDVSKIKDFYDFINSQRKTPLLIYQNLDKNTPLPFPNFRPWRVVIGLSFDKKTITVHDFYFGANYEISFDDFQKLWWPNGENPKTELRGFVAVYPKNYQELVKNSESNSPVIKRTQMMENNAPLMIKFLGQVGPCVRSASNVNVDAGNPETIKQWESLTGDSNFDAFLPIFKIASYICLGRNYEYSLNFDKVVDAYKKAVETDRDLNKPINGWPAMSESALSDPYWALSAILEKIGKGTEAEKIKAQAEKIGKPIFPVSGVF